MAPLALGVVLFLLGCGAGEHRGALSPSLVVGERAAPTPPAQLALAAKVAHRFAEAYARSVYLPNPPPIPGAAPSVQGALRAVASRIPLFRRGHRPRAGRLDLISAAADRIDASLVIADPRARSFSVGFTVERRPVGWRVVSISAPE